MYFRSLTIFGLISALGVGFFILRTSLLSLLGKGGASIPVLVGAMTCFGVGFLMDKLASQKEVNGLQRVLYSTPIFISGVLTGCLLNFFINGNPFNSSFGIGEEFFDWFIKPAYWLGIIGVPCSLFVGLVSFLTHKAIKKP